MNNVAAKKSTLRFRFWGYYPPCLICNKPVETAAVTFGYGSKFEMDIICPDCCAKYIDPIVQRERQVYTTGTVDIGVASCTK